MIDDNYHFGDPHRIVERRAMPFMTFDIIKSHQNNLKTNYVKYFGVTNHRLWEVVETISMKWKQQMEGSSWSVCQPNLGKVFG